MSRKSNIDRGLQWHVLTRHSAYCVPFRGRNGILTVYLPLEINSVMREGEPRLTLMDIGNIAAERGYRIVVFHYGDRKQDLVYKARGRVQ